MRAIVTVNLLNWEEQTDLEYEGDDLNIIMLKVVKDWPNYESIIFVVCKGQ